MSPAMEPDAPRSWPRRLFTLAMALVAAAWAARVVRDQGEVPRAARTLRRGDLDERRQALQELAAAGPGAMDTAIPALLGALGDPEAEIRSGAANHLGLLLGGDRTGPPARAAAPAGALASALPGLLDDPDPGVCLSAAAVLDVIRPATPAMVDALAEASARPDPVLAVVAISTLGRLEGQEDRVRPVLLEALRGDDPARRRAAAVVLRGPWGGDPELFRALVALLLDRPFVPPAPGTPPDPASLTTVLGSVADPPAEAVPDLAAALGHADPQVREAAASSLGRIGPDAQPAAPALIARIREEREPALIRAPVVALRQAGADPAEVVDALLARLRDADPGARRVAALLLLGHFDPGELQRAVPEIRAALARLDDPAPGLDGEWHALALALSRVDPGAEEVARYLEACSAPLKRGDDDPEAGGEAARSLGELGPAAAAATPALLEFVRRGGPARLVAADALCRIAPESAEAAEAVAVLLRDFVARPAEQGPIADALVGFGPAALPALQESARSANFWVRPRIEEIIARIEREAASPSPRLPAITRQEPIR